jgi:hypothetical protein
MLVIVLDCQATNPLRCSQHVTGIGISLQFVGKCDGLGGWPGSKGLDVE